MWEIVENGYTLESPESFSPIDERNRQLDAQAKDIICNCLSGNVFIRFRRLETAKQIWEALADVHEENVAHNDAQIGMLKAMSTHFRSLRKESFMELADRLSGIVDRLR